MLNRWAIAVAGTISMICLGTVYLRGLAPGGQADGRPLRLGDLFHARPVVAHPDETLRVVAHRMATTGLTVFPVVERGASPLLCGMISLRDLLEGRTHLLEAELRRERILRLRLPFLGRPASAAACAPGERPGARSDAP